MRQCPQETGLQESGLVQEGAEQDGASAGESLAGSPLGALAPSCTAEQDGCLLQGGALRLGVHSLLREAAPIWPKSLLWRRDGCQPSWQVGNGKGVKSGTCTVHDRGHPQIASLKWGAWSILGRGHVSGVKQLDPHGKGPRFASWDHLGQRYTSL